MKETLEWKIISSVLQISERSVTEVKGERSFKEEAA